MWKFLLLTMGLTAFATASAAAPRAAEAAPAIRSLVKPEMYKKLLDDREVYASAQLGDHHYLAQSAVLIRSSLGEVERLLVDDPSVYAKLIPYVSTSRREPGTGLVEIEGGIFHYRMHSFLKLQKITDRWTRFRVVKGNFTGMSGDLLFEDEGPHGTLAMVRAEENARPNGPKFVLETGAEIVFGFTARRMRSYVESQKTAALAPKDGEKKDDSGIPQPRSRL